MELIYYQLSKGSLNVQALFEWGVAHPYDNIILVKFAQRANFTHFYVCLSWLYTIVWLFW